MPNWSEMDLMQVDLAALSAEHRHGLYAEVERRARLERAQVLREGFAAGCAALCGSRGGRVRRQVYAPVPRGPLDLIFGGRA